ncbi:glutaredoxin family protein [Mailhella massiliensis]|uniref:glutaredoxin family protein n=1 Tax=Mailhella massiliensis TaxID=1903261 RepID=UPI00235635B2|nr:glutaredoxin family protein [Mailhella massiliensis]
METGSGALPLVGVVVIGVFLLILFFRRKNPAQKHRHVASVPDTGIPQGMEELYRWGVDPCSAGVPVMYTLHTCRHCVRLKDFLVQHGIEHRLVFVDEFDNPARKEIMATLRSYNARGSFPTLVAPDGRSVVGFREEAVKELLGLN